MTEDDILLDAELCNNLALLGAFLDKEAPKLGYMSFSEFKRKRERYIITPKKPNRPICYEDNPQKKRVFDLVYAQAKVIHNKKIAEYETQIQEQNILKQYDDSISGYAQFISEHNPISAPFLSRRHKIPVCEQQRQLHTYITGGTGSGKSEVIKSFIWHYLTKNTNTALLLLTPHGKIAEEVAKFKPNFHNDRLVYICPDLSRDYFPCFNPFDIENKENLNDREAENYAEEFRAVFQELLQDTFTEQMNALLKNTLPVLIKYPKSSIYDLLDFLSTTDTKASKYIEFANKNFKNSAMLDFLNGQFVSDNSYKRTKSSMQTRLHSIFSTTLMQKMIKGRSTIHLERLINQRKLIVFNIAKGMCPQEWDVIGKLIIAQIKIIAFRREKIPDHQRVPCHLFIDEFQNYITPSIQEILEESRKYRLYLTMAQQTAGAKMSNELLRSILGNTGVKFTGRNGDIETLGILAKSTGADVETMKDKLVTGRFSLWRAALQGEAQQQAIIITMPTNTLDGKASMTKEHWDLLKNEQIRLFYRSDDRRPAEDKGDAVEGEKTTKKHNINLNDYLN